MIEVLQNILKENKEYVEVLTYIYENPYSERKDIIDNIKSSVNYNVDVHVLLDNLASKLIIIELSSQASSTIESRVPKKVYLVNPDLENSLEDYL